MPRKTRSQLIGKTAKRRQEASLDKFEEFIKQFRREQRKSRYGK